MLEQLTRDLLELNEVSFFLKYWWMYVVSIFTISIFFIKKNGMFQKGDAYHE